MSDFWAGRRVLVTGHTGFKGAWLTLWLERLGAKVFAFALPPETEPSLCNILSAPADAYRKTADLNDAAAVARQVGEAQPEIIIHMAAQALVRRSYHEPEATFATNIMGTVNLLSAARGEASVKAIVVVTTDKVYDNAERGLPFAETDPLGGKDPYSASKACAEIISHCYRQSFFADGPALATARAGNVIGGGDWSTDRLVPDIIRAFESGEAVHLRYPGSVRPWQHVLEPLAGYLALARSLVERPRETPHAVNFGPDPQSFAPVHLLAETLGAALGASRSWRLAEGPHPPEAGLLTLQSGLAHQALDWRPRLSWERTLSWTADWYRAYRDGQPMRDFTLAQIAAYEELSR